MNKIVAVITGDIVKSTDIQIEYRDLLLDSTKAIVDDLNIIESLNIEFFRGDSFQMIVNTPENAVKIAILLRAGLKSHTPKNSKNLWDARISIGIGTISYNAEHVVVSDGEAFHFSGREMDNMGKRCLNIRTRWKRVNEELDVSTAFADDVISSWSIPQSQTAYQAILYNSTQKDIAFKFNQTKQNVSKLSNAAKVSLIQMYIERYKDLIISSINSDVQ